MSSVKKQIIVKVKNRESTADVIIDEEDKVYFDEYTMWLDTAGYTKIYYQQENRVFTHVLLKISELPSSMVIDHIFFSSLTYFWHITLVCGKNQWYFGGKSVNTKHLNMRKKAEMKKWWYSFDLKYHPFVSS